MTSNPAPVALTARSPEDLLAMVPIALGFHPVDSLVMLTFGQANSFHARIDLPRTRAEERGVIDALLAPVLRHRVKLVAVIAVCAEPGPVLGFMRRLSERLVSVGTEVKEALHSNGHSWSCLTPRGWTPAREYDVSAHPFLAEAVVRGEVIHRSRTDLSQTIVPDSEAVHVTARHLANLRGCVAHPAGGAWAEWATGLVARVVEGGDPLGADEVAGLLVALEKEEARIPVWWMMTRDRAEAHIDLWTQVVRSAPPDLVAMPAGLLGFAAWLAGHGALAWCAVDRCREVEPTNSVATLIDTLLRRAAPPELWEGFRDEWDAEDPE